MEGFSPCVSPMWSDTSWLVTSSPSRSSHVGSVCVIIVFLFFRLLWFGEQELITILFDVWVASRLTIFVSIFSSLPMTSCMPFAVVSLVFSRPAMNSLASPICDSRSRTRLFLRARPSLTFFSSASNWAIVLLQALRAVLLNSCSGFSVLTFEDLCLVEVVGNVGVVCGSQGRG